MNDFVAIDFEAANDAHSSVCAIGVCIYKEGTEAGRYYSLIQPLPNYYSFYATRIHGLRKCDTDNAPKFPRVWHEVVETICTAYGAVDIEQVMATKGNKNRGIPFVAYNKQFDEDCLKKAHAAYKLPYPCYKFVCSYRAAEKQLKGITENLKLDTVSAYCGYTMQHHHNAQDDAVACAYIARQLL